MTREAEAIIEAELNTEELLSVVMGSEDLDLVDAVMESGIRESIFDT